MRVYGEGLADMEELFLNANQQLCDHIRTFNGQPVNLASLLSSYVLNILATLVRGECSNGGSLTVVGDSRKMLDLSHIWCPINHQLLYL